MISGNGVKNINGPIKINVSVNLVNCYKFVTSESSKQSKTNLSIKVNKNHSKECVHLKPDGQSVELLKEQEFMNPTLFYFDYTFDFNILKQSQIINNNQLLDNLYRLSVRNSVLDVLNGYNSAIAIYGQEESNTIGTIYGLTTNVSNQQSIVDKNLSRKGLLHILLNEFFNVCKEVTVCLFHVCEQNESEILYDLLSNTSNDLITHVENKDIFMNNFVSNNDNNISYWKAKNEKVALDIIRYGLNNHNLQVNNKNQKQYDIVDKIKIPIKYNLILKIYPHSQSNEIKNSQSLKCFTLMDISSGYYNSSVVSNNRNIISSALFRLFVKELHLSITQNRTFFINNIPNSNKNKKMFSLFKELFEAKNFNFMVNVLSNIKYYPETNLSLNLAKRIMVIKQNKHKISFLDREFETINEVIFQDNTNNNNSVLIQNNKINNNTPVPMNHRISFYDLNEDLNNNNNNNNNNISPLIINSQMKQNINKSIITPSQAIDTQTSQLDNTSSEKSINRIVSKSPNSNPSSTKRINVSYLFNEDTNNNNNNSKYLNINSSNDSNSNNRYPSYSFSENRSNSLDNSSIVEDSNISRNISHSSDFYNNSTSHLDYPQQSPNKRFVRVPSQQKIDISDNNSSCNNSIETLSRSNSFSSLNPNILTTTTNNNNNNNDLGLNKKNEYKQHTEMDDDYSSPSNNAANNIMSLNFLQKWIPIIVKQQNRQLRRPPSPSKIQTSTKNNLTDNSNYNKETNKLIADTSLEFKKIMTENNIILNNNIDVPLSSVNKSPNQQRTIESDNKFSNIKSHVPSENYNKVMNNSPVTNKENLKSDVATVDDYNKLYDMDKISLQQNGYNNNNNNNNNKMKRPEPVNKPNKIMNSNKIATPTSPVKKTTNNNARNERIKVYIQSLTDNGIYNPKGIRKVTRSLSPSNKSNNTIKNSKQLMRCKSTSDIHEIVKGYVNKDYNLTIAFQHLNKSFPPPFYSRSNKSNKPAKPNSLLVLPERKQRVITSNIGNKGGNKIFSPKNNVITKTRSLSPILDRLKTIHNKNCNTDNTEIISDSMSFCISTESSVISYGNLNNSKEPFIYKLSEDIKSTPKAIDTMKIKNNFNSSKNIIKNCKLLVHIPCDNDESSSFDFDPVFY